MNREFEALEVLKNRALSDLDNIPKTAIPICEKSNEEVMKTYKTLKQALTELKAIKEDVGYIGGRSFSKEILYLKQCIEQYNDKPIFYMSRIYGNKYIVSQEEYEKLNKENIKQKKILAVIKNIIKFGDDLISILSFDTYEEYCKHSCDYDYKLAKEEFDLLIEVLGE